MALAAGVLTAPAVVGTASVIMKPTSGPPAKGERVWFRFGVSETVTVASVPPHEGTAAISSTGTFSASFTVPKWARPGEFPPDPARLARGHFSIEAHHHVGDVTFGEDTATSRTGGGPANLATIRAPITAAIKDAGYLHVPDGRRDHTTQPKPSASTASIKDRSGQSRNAPEPWRFTRTLGRFGAPNRAGESISRTAGLASPRLT